jgi:WD40 repeat protein/predicted Ser/Thr protein kinase
MANALTCPRCGTALPGRALGGLCPRCLLDSAVRLAASDAAPAESDAVESAKVPGPSFPSAAPAGTPAPTGRFGNYEMLRRVAAGGMGVVYQARQLGLDRLVALKVLPFGPFTREEFVRRFELEASAAARLHHPAIVTIYEVGRADGYPFFSMEYVEGPTLAELVRGEPLPTARAVRLVRTIAEAVHYAHGQGILHRDLKPSNVLVDGLDQPRITDFGLARDLSDKSDLTQTGQAIGSPNFMPPEQAEGRSKDITVWSDVYGLGAILYYLVTGRPPFAADSALATLRQVTHDEPVPPRRLNPALPGDLDTLCLRCLEKSPSRRYASAGEVAQELGRFQRGEPILARPISLPQRAWRWCRRQPVVAGLLALTVTIFAAGFTATAWQWRRAERNAGRLAESVTRLEIERAEDRLDRGETGDALASLARLLRAQPEHRVAAWRILSVLSRRSFARPEALVVQDDFVGRNSAFAQSGHNHKLVTATNDARVLQLWDVQTTPRLERHLTCPEPVRVTAFRPDGAQLAAATARGQILVFDVAQGSLLAGPHPTGAYIDRIVLSPDGRHCLAHVSDSGSDAWRKARVRVYETATGRLAREEARMHWAAFSPDGHVLVTVEDSVARLRDPATWEILGGPLRHGARINTAEFSPDSRFVLTASADGTARRWLTTNGQPAGPPLRHRAQVLTAVFSPDSGRVLTADLAGDGQLWDAAVDQPLGQPFKLDRTIGPDSFSADGALVAAHSRDKLWLRHAATGAPYGEPIAAGHRIARARFVGESHRLLLSTFGGAARTWHVPPPPLREVRLANRGEVNRVAFSADGTRVVTAARERASRVWDAATGRPVTSPLPHRTQATYAAFSPDGRRVLTVSSDGVQVWEVPSGQPVGAPLRHRRPVRFANFSPDGRWIVTTSEDATARLWNADSLQPVGETLRHSDFVVWAAFSPRSEVVATGSHDHTVRVWRVAEGTAAGPALRHSNAVQFIGFDATGRRLISCGDDRAARIWDAATGQPLVPPLRHEAAVTCAHFDAPGRRIVTASDDATARIWDAATGQPLGRRLQHADAVEWAEFSPDGRFVVTASKDQTARVWDAATGQPITDALRHEGSLTSVCWSPDGRQLATASNDRTARLWAMDFLADAPAPRWLAELAEAVAGKRLDGAGHAETVPPRVYLALREQLLAQPVSPNHRKWLERLLSATRAEE